VGANPGLNPGLLVSREHEFVGSERLAVPEALVQVENGSSFSNEVGIAGEDPTTVAPRTYRIPAQPSPKSTSADLGDDTLSKYFVWTSESEKREKGNPRRDGNSQATAFTWTTALGGKARWPPASRLLIESRQAELEEPLSPFADDLPRQVKARGNSVI